MVSASNKPPAAWQEDEWEPAEQDGDVLPLEEIRKKIQLAQNEHEQKGHIKVSGRTIIVCHTLPYTCNYVREDVGPDSTQSLAHGTEVQEHEEIPALHTPTIDPDARLPSEDKAQPVSPFSSVYGDKQHPLSPTSSSNARWVLKPRRVHAALNSGVKSLSENSEIVLVSWPGDIRNVDGSKVGAGSLSAEQRTKLEDGFEDVARKEKGGGIRCVPVWMDDKVASGFYNDYCKGFLWPTFHYLGLSDHQDSTVEANAWQAYYDANLEFAKRVAEVYQEGDMVWVQDYHLLLVPKMLREMRPNAAIGLFLHSPFPSSEFFRCLPRREEILNGMLGANLCCFQTYSYGRHFLSSCVRVCGYEALEGGIGVDAHGSITSIAYCPIGIDSDRINEERKSPAVPPKIEALRQLYKGKKIIVGRDKMDSTKGVLPKLEAFEALLDQYPEYIGNVVLIQVTTPTANDSPLVARKISRLVDHINGTYGNLSFAPLHHYHQMIDRDEYFALLTVADLALITSIRDGMNTTSMEYVLCQKENKAPLILSEFTGVTGSMKEAVKVNPWDSSGVARAIDQCLKMQDDERARRHAQLYKRVTIQTAAVWAHMLILRLLESLKHDPASNITPRLDAANIAKRYKESKKRLLMFDYDGTLTPIVKTPEAAVPSLGLLDTLEKMAADPKNVVYIISGRDAPFLQQHLGHIANLGFSAEHGSFLRDPGETEWRNLTEHIDMSWKDDVEEIFKYYEARTTGSFVEKKRAGLTFHYRNADPEYGEFQAKECQALLDAMVDKLPIDVMVGKKNLEVRPAHTHKGEIVKRLTYQHSDAEFLLCAGDDKTDEDMFRAVFAIESTGSAAGDRPLVVTPPPSLTLFPSLAKQLVPDALKPPTDGANPSASDSDKLVLQPVSSNYVADNLFTVAVIPSASRKTIANWYIDEPVDFLEVLAKLVA